MVGGGEVLVTALSRGIVGPERGMMNEGQSDGLERVGGRRWTAASG
jgi:hypothetical protein